MTILKHTINDLSINILLTSVCNAGCPWCIANEYLSKKNTTHLISDINIEKILKFTKDKNISQINLLGGEPSLHPKALDYAKKIFELNIPVGFSTNGFWNDDFRFKLNKVNFPIEFEITYLGKKQYSKIKYDHLIKTFEQLNTHPASIGIIIMDKNQDYTEHLKIAKKYGFELRWALIEPTIRSGITDEYKYMTNLKRYGKLILKMIKKANGMGINTWADLSVPRCTFEDNQINLFESNMNDIQFKCPPFMDISPDLDIWRCLPLAPENTVKLTKFKSFKEAYYYANKIKNDYNDIGIFKKCHKCKYFNKICSGGPTIAKKIKFKRNKL